MGKQYSGDGRDLGSTYLVNTLNRYDPVARTVELGHRHGLEVWAWDTLFDYEATIVYYGADTGPDLSQRFGEYPLKDPFQVENSRFQWRLDPPIDAKQQEEAAARDLGTPIWAIRISSDTRSDTNLSTGEMFDILVSSDNRRYCVYEGDWEFRVESANAPVLIIDGLKIREPYVKLAFHKPWPVDQSFTITGEADGSFCVRMSGSGAMTIDYRFACRKKIESRQVGIVLDLPKRCDRLTWQREYDESPLGTNDFRATRTGIRRVSLADDTGCGLDVVSDGTQAARAWLEGDRGRLLVAAFSRGTGEGFLRKKGFSAAKLLTLEPGQTVKGTTRTSLRMPNDSATH